MYFNHEKDDTNIDSEFDNKKRFNFNFDFSKFKVPFIIFGVILLIIIGIIIFFNINNKTKYFIILKGNQEITIYKGDDYNEPGYMGTDDMHNVLTDKIIVKNEVNTDIVGEYKITYTLKNVTKTRYVNVIEKPIGETLIYLKGNLNMYLKVGEKYVEPGYTATDTVDGSLTDKVKIDNKVNTSKVGTYRITYTVVNSSGITKSVTRTVIVTE